MEEFREAQAAGFKELREALAAQTASIKELREAQAANDYKLNALIDTADKMIRKNGRGRKK
jgi:hypothetical protein